MKYLDASEMSNLLIEEYPILRKSDIKIFKQFQTQHGRKFNTFLVTSEKAGFEQFVAKSTVLEKYSLELEWRVLKILEENNADAPKLLLRDHQPQKVMLLEYIEGINAAELVENEKEKVFKEVAIATGKLHTTRVKKFGNLLYNTSKGWKEYLQIKIQERLNGIKHLISKDLYYATLDFFNNLGRVIDEESQEPPVLIHRDIYFDNFIIKKNSNQAILIDYGMTIGGRPFYDLAKFYILELYKDPDYRDVFLESYSKFVPLPEDFNERMKLYILKEALGMINYFNQIDDIKQREHAVAVLGELIFSKGVIYQLLT